MIDVDIPGKRRGRPNLRRKDASRRDMTEDNATNRAARRKKIISYTGDPRWRDKPGMKEKCMDLRCSCGWWSAPCCRPSSRLWWCRGRCGTGSCCRAPSPRTSSRAGRRPSAGSPDPRTRRPSRRRRSARGQTDPSRGCRSDRSGETSYGTTGKTRHGYNSHVSWVNWGIVERTKMLHIATWDADKITML